MFHTVYHGNIGREETERRLEQYGREGSFLTRDSESVQGSYCLCVRRDTFVRTYRISWSTEGWAVKALAGVKPQIFNTLNELIESYWAAPPYSMAPLVHPLERSAMSKEGLAPAWYLWAVEAWGERFAAGTSFGMRVNLHTADCSVVAMTHCGL